MSETELTFREAVRGDESIVLRFIKGIAEYERMSGEVEATEDGLRHWLFDERRAQVVFASVNGEEVAFALYYYNFSTFTGCPGLYLEDIFVEPGWRGRGIGKSLFGYLRNKARDMGCGRMEWVCLDWNEPGISFYKSMGARAMDEWTVYRLGRCELDGGE